MKTRTSLRLSAMLALALGSARADGVVCAAACCPERENDFVWENDKFGMRAYGPGEFHKWSGFDVFNKGRNAGSAVEMMHHPSDCGDWHRVPWKGVVDNYTMGASRGVGGVAMYADGEWKTYPDWESSRVIHTGDDYLEFELVYPAFSAAGKMTCHITLRKGERFFRNDVSFERMRKDFLVGPGIDLDPQRGHKGSVCETSSAVSVFEDAKPAKEGGGSTMSAIFVAPDAEVTPMTDHLNCRVLAFRGQRTFTYWAGASWSEAGEVTTALDWHDLVRRFQTGVAPAAHVVPDDDLQKQCQAVCDWAVREGLQGALQFCAYRDGECIVDVWAGTMTTNAGAAKIDGTSLFPVYSTEKPLLEAAVHRAVEQGKMSYDSPLWTWWPEFKDDGSSGKNDLTLAETLAFRSGMPPRYPKDLFPTVEDECNWRKILDWAASVAPEIRPGTKQRYMSVSYAWMLGHPLEVAMGKPLNDVLVDEVLRPCGIERDFYFAAGDAEIPRIVTVYKSKSFEKMNDDRRRRMCMPSAWAVANARAVAKFYNRLCGFDGRPPFLRKETLDYAVRPNRHPDDPIPEDVDEKWYMIFGTGFGLWGERSNLTRVFGHGGLGGSEGLCDRSQRLTVGFTCNFATDVGKVRAKLYGLVGMKWRYWKDAEADIQDIQMKSIGAARFESGRK